MVVQLPIGWSAVPGANSISTTQFAAPVDASEALPRIECEQHRHCRRWEGLRNVALQDNGRELLSHGASDPPSPNP